MNYARAIPSLSALLLSTTVTVSIAAHEFWIEPASHRVEAGQLLRASLRVGERFQGKTVARDETVIKRFSLFDREGEHAVVGRSGSPVHLVRAQGVGVGVLAYRSHRSSHRMDADQFERYLRGEGLDFVIKRRAVLNESDAPGREVYSRCAKALVLIGKGDDVENGYDRRVGHPLEIVPNTSPFALAAGETLRFQVLFHGQPLAGSKVVFVNQREPRKLRTSVTDASGKVELQPITSGRWMVTTIHMTRAPRDVDADWESLWASLTFETR